MERVQIGWAKTEVSTERPVPLMGQNFMRVSQGIQDPLYVTALAVDGGGPDKSVILVSCDIVVLRSGIIQKTIDKALALDPSIPGDAVVMNATHTHTGGKISPSGAKDVAGVETVPWEEYNEFYADQAAAAIAQAWQSRKPGGVSYGYSYAVVGHSRRPVYFVDKSDGKVHTSNGHAVMYGNTDDPEFSHYEAGADHFVNVMITYDDKERITGFIINVPCPSQVSEVGYRFSADYWNEVREAVKKEFGKDVYVLPQCAAAGDLSPRILHYKAAQARRMALKYDLPYDPTTNWKDSYQDWYNKTTAERLDIAERILFAVKDVASWAGKDIRTDVPVDHVKVTVDLKRRIITEEDYQRCLNALETYKLVIPEGATEEEIRRKTSNYKTIVAKQQGVIWRYKNQYPEKRIPMIMHVFRIGDAAFATNKFELYQDFQHRMQARSPFLQTFIIQLAGDEGGTYLPTQRAMENRGYGAAFYENWVGAEGGQQIVEETLKLLQELKEKDGQ